MSFQVTKKLVTMKRVSQGYVKKLFPTKDQTPFVKMKKERKPLGISHYHRLNEKLKENVQEEGGKSEDSTTSTSSDDLES